MFAGCFPDVPNLANFIVKGLILPPFASTGPVAPNWRNNPCVCMLMMLIIYWEHPAISWCAYAMSYVHDQGMIHHPVKWLRVLTQLCSWRRSKWTNFFTPKRSWSTFQCKLFLHPKDEEQTRRHAPARTDIEIEDNKTVNFDMCKPPSGIALCLCSIQPIHEIGLKGSLQPICSHTGLCFGTGCCGRRLEVFTTGCLGDVVGYQEWWW